MSAAASYDVVIVGGGISGAMIAKRLGLQGKKVLILEAGDDVPASNGEFLGNFYLSQQKGVEIPYTPPVFGGDPTTDAPQPLNDPKTAFAGRPSVFTLGPGSWNDPTKSYLLQQGPFAFGSTYERIAGGTTRHWLGTSFRFVPNDFRMKSTYNVAIDWPIGYDDLERWYGEAEHEIGVSANVEDQGYHGITFAGGYTYPMPQIPNSLVDHAVDVAAPNVPPFNEIALAVTNTPAARNSIPYQDRRVCAGNTNCIPICPIQAKYDASVTLADAAQTGNVDRRCNAVATHVTIGADGNVSEIRYRTYTPDGSAPPSAEQSVSAKLYVIAAHAIETPKLLLLSTNGGRFPNGVANSSGKVGKHLMDHVMYLAWAQSPQPVYPYRGPLSTAGIESLRDGAFRKDHAAMRIEIGNEGWNWPAGDPATTALDFICGANASGTNPGNQALFGRALAVKLNELYTKQFRLGYLIEQTPEDDCFVSVDPSTKDPNQLDALGIPRPKITYNLSDYTKLGFVVARKTATAIFDAMGATEKTAFKTKDDYQPTNPKRDGSVFEVTYTGDPVENVPLKVVPSGTDGATTEYFNFWGAGHIVGTYRMGNDKSNSVVDPNLRSWDHHNLYLVGSGVFPTVATGNPTLTIAAMALRASDAILQQLKHS